MSTAPGAQPTSSTQPVSRDGDRQEDTSRLEQAYGSPDAHVYLSQAQVERMVDSALERSTSVKYMLESLRQAREL
jgi:hypothetical protein